MNLQKAIHQCAISVTVSCAIVTLFSPANCSGADLTSTWDGSIGNWSDATRWSTDLFPHNGNGGFTYDAIVSGGMVTLDQNIEIEVLTFTLPHANITGEFDLSLDELNWQHGTMDGTGTTRTAGGSFNADQFKRLNRTLEITGPFKWLEGSINGTSGHLVVKPGGSFDIKGGDCVQTNDCSGLEPDVSVEAGATITKAESSYRSIAGTFANEGTVMVDGIVDEDEQFEYALTFRGDGSGSGAFEVNGGRLWFGGGTHDYTGAFSGAGLVKFAGGTVNINPGARYSVSNTQVGHRDMINVGPGTVNFNTGTNVELGNLNFIYGTIGGSDDTTIVVAGGSFDDTLPKTLNGTLEITGPFKWLGGSINGTNGHLVVKPGGSFDISGSFSHGLEPEVTVESDAFITKTGSGRPSIVGTFTNDGTVVVNEDLAFRGDGSGNGDFMVNGGTLWFLGGMHDYTGAFSGSGTVEFSGETVNLNPGASYSVSNTQVTGGTVNFNTGTNVDLGSLLFTSGAISGSDDIRTLRLDWQRGTMDGTGTTRTAGGSLIGQNFRTLNRTLEITGPFGWPTADIKGTNGHLVVKPGGSFNISGSLSQTLEPDVTVEAGAAINKEGSSSRTISGTFTNDGTVVVDGTVEDFGYKLIFRGDGSGNGDFMVNGGTLWFLGGMHDYTGAFSGAGTVEFSGETVNLNPGASYSVSNTQVTGGTVNFNTGTNVELNNLVFTDGEISAGNDVDVSVNGTATFTNDFSGQQLTFSLAPGQTFTIAPTGEANLLHGRGGEREILGNVINQGTLIITGDTYIGGSLTLDLGSETLIDRNSNIFIQRAMVDEGITNNGTLTLKSDFVFDATISPGLGFPFTNGPTGVVAGTGNITGFLENSGLVSPGESAGTITVGEFVQDSTGGLEIEIGGTESDQSDLLVVEGTALLAGDLQLSLLDSFTPNYGDEVVFVDAAGGLSGNFETILGIDVNPDMSLAVLYDDFQVSVMSVLPGDATLDGTVDGEDFIAWNAHKFTSGGTWVDGDFNGDNIVDGLDFIIWNSHKFTSTSSIAVPEPISGLMMTAGIVAIVLTAERRAGTLRRQ